MQFEILAKLERDLADLAHELRHVIPQELAKAAAYGDLSENAEYDAAKERKVIVESRIANLQKRISEIKSINVGAIPTDRIGLGSTVVLEDQDTGDEVIYHFVFPEEVEPDHGKISLASPIGKGLVGRQEGDEVKITTPRGTRSFEIVTLTTIHDKRDN